MARQGVMCANGRTMHRNAATKAKCRECKVAQRGTFFVGKVGAVGGGADALPDGVVLRYPDSSSVVVAGCDFGGNSRVRNMERDVNLVLEDSDIEGSVSVVRGGVDKEGTSESRVEGCSIGDGASLTVGNAMVIATEIEDGGVLHARDSAIDDCIILGGGYKNLERVQATFSTFGGSAGAVGALQEDSTMKISNSEINSDIVSRGDCSVIHSSINAPRKIDHSVFFPTTKLVVLENSHVSTSNRMFNIESYGFCEQDDEVMRIKNAFGVDFRRNMDMHDSREIDVSALAMPLSGGRRVLVSGDKRNHEYRLMSGTPGVDGEWVYYGTHGPYRIQNQPAIPEAQVDMSGPINAGFAHHKLHSA